MRNSVRLGVLVALMVSAMQAQAEWKVTAVAPEPAKSSKAADVSQDPLEAGNNALKAGKPAEAERYFLQSQKVRPKEIEPLLGLAMAAQLQGKKLQARSWMDRALALQPQSAPLLKAYGQLLVEQKSPEDIKAIYWPVISDPAAPLQVRLDYGNWLLEVLQRPGEAVDVFRAALRQKPTSAEASLGLGLALAGEKRWDSALVSLEEAVKLDAGNPFVHQALGMVALRSGKAERALAAFDKALGLRAALPLSALGRAEALAALNRVPAAIEAYRAAIKAAPDRAAGHIQLAQLLERENRLAEAEPVYREALRLDPANIILKNNLAYVLSQLGRNLDEALQLIRDAEKMEPRRAAFIDTRGSVHLAAGDVPAARTAFEQALKLEPENAVFKRHLAQASGPVSKSAKAPDVRPAPEPAKAPAASVASAPPAPAASLPSAPAKQSQPASEPSKPAATVVAAAAPKPAPPAPAKAPADPAQVIGPIVENWRTAWERKDVAAYLGYYAKTFTPGGGKSRTAWEADRRSKLEKPGAIAVKLNSPAYLQSGETITVVFDQDYSSASFKDKVRKELVWVKEGDQWRIRQENIR